MCYAECSDDKKRTKQPHYTKIFNNLFTNLIKRHYFITNEYDNYIQKYKSLQKFKPGTNNLVSHMLY